jgi:hypothetical protein
VRAAGLEHRSPYALRHTYATFAIGAGVSLFELARFMGTSVEQIDRTYGHLLPDSLERARTALDTFAARQARLCPECARSVGACPAAEDTKALRLQGPLRVGAPGFEPGTSSPPD